MEYKRTHNFMELNETCVGLHVTVNGWVQNYRNHGGLHFLSLRDRYAILQIVIEEQNQPDIIPLLAKLRDESCIAARGLVALRPDDMINPDMQTGRIELRAEEIHIFSTAEVLPIQLAAEPARDDLRLRYRYLDLRREVMQTNIRLRHSVSQCIREYLVQKDFFELETPTMIRSTPEGARDFLVPSRLQPGSCYALAQSPQLYKQLLMIAGFDRYFQLARCYRDEDARGDRQPEHTQVDIEMSFIDSEDIFALNEGMFAHLFEHCMHKTLATPFPRLTYKDAMNRYGSDKPDLRFELPLLDFNAYAEQSDFSVFRSALANKGVVKMLIVKGRQFSRSEIQTLEGIATTYGAKGLAWTKVIKNETCTLEGGIGKFFQHLTDKMVQDFSIEPGDMLFFVADAWHTACTALGAVRSEIGKQELGSKTDDFRFAWIVDFPLFEWNDDSSSWQAAHHMFTMPKQEYREVLEDDPGAVHAELYDLVCNGNEIASGSIRIHDPALQQRVFKILGMSDDDANERFGFLLEAMKYGAPPHGGIAHGLDRLVMLMAGAESIRDVIPFPKNTLAASPLDGAPAPVDNMQLNELGLHLA